MRIAAIHAEAHNKGCVWVQTLVAQTRVTAATEMMAVRRWVIGRRLMGSHAAWRNAGYSPGSGSSRQRWMRTVVGSGWGMGRGGSERVNTE